MSTIKRLMPVIVCLLSIAGANPLWAQQALPPALAGLFPKDAKEVSGQVFYTPAPDSDSPSVSAADLYGEIPGKHTCSGRPEMGKLLIKITAIKGGEDPGFFAKQYAEGYLQNARMEYQRAKDEDSGTVKAGMKKLTLRREEPIEGGTVFYTEFSDNCLGEVNRT